MGIKCYFKHGQIVKHTQIESAKNVTWAEESVPQGAETESHEELSAEVWADASAEKVPDAVPKDCSEFKRKGKCKRGDECHMSHDVEVKKKGLEDKQADDGSADDDVGHDYRRVDDGSVSCDESKVNSMLAERMRAKMARDFDTADRLRVCRSSFLPDLMVSCSQ